MRNAHGFAGLLMASVIGLGACKPSAPAGETDAVQRQPAVEAGRESLPPSAQPAKKRDASTGKQSHQAPLAAADDSEQLRFDMTQDGEPQTADKFDQWMEEQGVQIATGDMKDVPAKKADAAAGTKR